MPYKSVLAAAGALQIGSMRRKNSASAKPAKQADLRKRPRSVIDAISFKAKMVSKGRRGAVKSGSFVSPGFEAHSLTSARLLVAQLNGQRLTLRQRCFLLLYEPQSSSLAALTALVIWACLLASSTCAAMETIDWLTDLTGPRPFLHARVVLNGVFSVEVLARVCCYIPLRRAWRDPFLWTGLLAILPFWVRVAAYPTSLTVAAYLRPDTRTLGSRVLEALASIRLVNLCRYYEGGAILARAAAGSASQLGVPLFLFGMLTITFSLALYELEWDSTIERCASAWRSLGVESAFLAAHPAGVAWDCSVCAITGLGSGECVTCRGYPLNATECLGRPWGQRFRSVPETMWFVGVTMSTRARGMNPRERQRPPFQPRALPAAFPAELH